jgi:hypothetical protein
MSIAITYVDINQRPVGSKTPTDDESVLDAVLTDSYLSAEYAFEPPLSSMDVSLLNYRDKPFQDHEHVLQYHARNPIAHRDPTTMELELWNAYFWDEREHLAHLLQLQLSGKIPRDLRLGEVRIDTIDTELYAELWVPVGRQLTFGQLEQKTRNLDTEFSAIWQRVSRVCHGVLPPANCIPESASPTVFLCHSTLDKSFVRKLRDELRKRGVKVWLDEEQILVGHDFVDRMEEGISNAEYTVVVLSPRFVSSGPWAKEEYRAALSKQIAEKRVVLLPILLESCEIPALLRSKRYADFRESFEEGVSALVYSIQHHKK